MRPQLIKSGSRMLEHLLHPRRENTRERIHHAPEVATSRTTQHAEPVVQRGEQIVQELTNVPARLLPEPMLNHVIHRMERALDLGHELLNGLQRLVERVPDEAR